MKHIFNSLGSNYTNEFVWLSVWSRFLSKKQKLKNYANLTSTLGKQFDGKAFLFYKGRDAIEFALRAHELTNKQVVLTQAFTCYAIEEAIIRAGAKPVYIDIEKNSTNLSLETLKTALKNNPHAKALIVQHSLGQPADIESIALFCKENKILLIEDLAQSFGGVDVKGKTLGSYADVVVSSFGRDKIIDAVTGGVTILKKSNDIDNGLKIYQDLETGPLLTKEALYPFSTWIVRKTYSVIFGQILHKLLNLTKFFTNPISAHTNEMTTLPAAYAGWALWQLSNLEEQLNHRKKIANIYNQNIKIVNSKNDVQFGINQRFILEINNPKKIIINLKQENIHLSDRWYREAVDCGKTNCISTYKKGNCPNAENLSKTIINLPTHSNLTVIDAEKIALKINNFK